MTRFLTLALLALALGGCAKAQCEEAFEELVLPAAY